MRSKLAHYGICTASVNSIIAQDMTRLPVAWEHCAPSCAKPVLPSRCFLSCYRKRKKSPRGFPRGPSVKQTDPLRSVRVVDLGVTGPGVLDIGFAGNIRLVEIAEPEVTADRAHIQSLHDVVGKLGID